jgi:hypothetical protein
VLTSNGTTWSSAAASPTNGYRRNRIINGDMRIDQRNGGASQSITAGSSAYTVDRWVVGPTGANSTSGRVAGPTGYQYTYQLNGAAGITKIDFQQRIESYNVADLVNQNVTLSATIANSLLTTVTWTAFYPNTVDNTAGGVTQIATGTFTVSSTAAQYTATFNAGANAANGILINFSVGAQTSGTCQITGVQLEAGSLATPFERLPIGETLMLCQRYFYSSYAEGQKPGQASVQAGFTSFSPTNGGYYSVAQSNYPVTMRAAPTVVSYSPNSGASGYYYQNNSLVDATTLINTINVSFTVFANGNSPLLGGMWVHLTANAEL